MGLGYSSWTRRKVGVAPQLRARKAEMQRCQLHPEAGKVQAFSEILPWFQAGSHQRRDGTGGGNLATESEAWPFPPHFSCKAQMPAPSHLGDEPLLIQHVEHRAYRDSLPADTLLLKGRDTAQPNPPCTCATGLSRGRFLSGLLLSWAWRWWSQEVDMEKRDRLRWVCDGNVSLEDNSA